MANTIVTKGGGIRKERLAGGAITPGHLVKVTSTGTVVAQSGNGVAVPPAFAVENEVFGDEIDIAYASGDNVIYEVLQPGSEVQALVAAAALAIAVGDMVESTGDGTVEVLSAGVAIGMALEAVDNSGGGTPARIKIEVL